MQWVARNRDGIGDFSPNVNYARIMYQKEFNKFEKSEIDNLY